MTVIFLSLLFLLLWLQFLSMSFFVPEQQPWSVRPSVRGSLLPWHRHELAEADGSDAPNQRVGAEILLGALDGSFWVAVQQVKIKLPQRRTLSVGISLCYDNLNYPCAWYHLTRKASKMTAQSKRAQRPLFYMLWRSRYRTFARGGPGTGL